MTATAMPVDARQSEAFPQLTPEQPVTKIFIVVSGRLDARMPYRGTNETAIAFLAGMFTGERSILTGGRFLGQIAASEPTDVIEIERDELLKLIQTDTELSDVFLRAFILRRLQLIERGTGDVIVLGSNHCAGMLHLLEFLVRNGHPYTV